MQVNRGRRSLRKYSSASASHSWSLHDDDSRRESRKVTTPLLSPPPLPLPLTHRTQAQRSSDMLTNSYEESKAFHTSAAAAMPGVNQDNTSELEHQYGEALPSLLSHYIRKRKYTEDCGPRFSNSSFTVYPQNRPSVCQSSVPAVNCSVTNTQPTHPPLQTSSSCLRRSHSVPSLSLTTSAKNKTFTRSKSLPDMLFKPSCEEFTPDITVDENDETYRFQCSCPGLYQCSVTGLLFHMEGEGDVVYRIVPWNRRLLARHHKQPAGPLFDIKCLQQSVCRLHLPHCEIRSTGGGEFLSVAHVNDEGIEFIGPQKITETHVVINITGFSGFGNVKDEDSPADPVRALVLLFYRPPADPDAESLLNVLLLPRNVVLRDVLRTRKKLVGDESYIETSPHCKLQPKQEYTLSTCPAEDSVLVQPTEAEFDCDNYDNYFPSFQVILETMRKHVKLFLRDTNSSHSVWERRVCLTGVKSEEESALNLSSDKRLLDIRSSFIEGISGPVLTSLLDKLFEKTVIAEAEKESADEMQNRRDKARFVIDSVRKKGEAASSEMIEFLCEADPFLCEHLGLI
ncbi:NACHT, LRR and PYD domains-containing protein 1b allele 3-like [Micropterus dolomieu]|uniref:NACHT, LRR and PYD domains-containing protein 1b allele 3-like n=1 Tax=Micropterus dolomieu TaxID=147949 RepID=UPI001E8D15DF|nr:NACHT, LRR and PYD domains-containing protein 1b allele 3-like [Micropterus dolomieu]